MNTVVDSISIGSVEEESLDDVFTSIEADFTHIIETCNALLSQLAIIRNRLTEMELNIDGLSAPEWINERYTEFQSDTIHNQTWGQYLIEKLEETTR